MSRIRSIHPGLWTDETFAALSDAATLLYVGLLTECDDQGVFEWKPLQLRMRLRPAKDGGVDHLLSELEQANVIRRYNMGGKVYGAVRNFCKYQKPKFPKIVHPSTSDIADYVASKHLATEGNQHSTPSPTVETAVEPPVVPRNAETRVLMEEGGGSGSGKGDLGQDLKLDPEFGVPSAIVAGLVKRAARKMEKSNYLWLNQTDTRVDRAKAWWREQYGSELPVAFNGQKQGFRVPWAAVQ